MNGDGVLIILDLVIVASAIGEGGQGMVADVNRDGVVNILDLVKLPMNCEGKTAVLGVHIHFFRPPPVEIQEFWGVRRVIRHLTTKNDALKTRF